MYGRLATEFTRHPAARKKMVSFSILYMSKGTHKRMKVMSKKKNNELNAIEAFQVATQKICIMGD